MVHEASHQKNKELINSNDVNEIICAGPCQLPTDRENVFNEIMQLNIEMLSWVAIEIKKLLARYT